MYMPMQPVSLWETDSTKRTLADVEGAARFLLERWPEGFEESAQHRAARQAALDALNGHVPVAAFRLALIAAAGEAGLLADPPAQGVRLG
ncbi:hypothetical protein J2X65_003128 [Ancylobacter sp. 3268]|uniref:DUF982 domain-containing protein n=1 Tax=Ancylobacter sp. 3268 TaxID=2817752 RepID=UPI00285ACB56|nr:DUF982 domain-containing protein [Ancylobacter sp. 3268]MDR6953765.1 hypothetical protein [Ancylobacter sp. 3268]